MKLQKFSMLSKNSTGVYWVCRLATRNSAAIIRKARVAARFSF